MAAAQDGRTIRDGPVSTSMNPTTVAMQSSPSCCRDVHINDVFAVQGVRNAMVLVCDDMRDYGTGHTAASGLRQTTLSSRRQRDGLRQRGCEGFVVFMVDIIGLGGAVGLSRCRGG